jgi:hypothetical protein
MTRDRAVAAGLEADGTRSNAPARATLAELAAWQRFDIYDSMPPPETVFRLVTIPLASLTHHPGLTVQVFWDDPPGYYLAMRAAARARLLPPIVVTPAEIIDGYHRIVLALGGQQTTINAYLPEDESPAGPTDRPIDAAARRDEHG